MSNSPSANIPWYRTRRFWAIAIGVQITISFLLLLQPALDPNVNFSIVSSLLVGSGVMFWVFVINFFTKIIIFDFSNIVLLSIYTIYLLVLAYAIFYKPLVNIKYPTIYLLIGVLSTVVVMLMFNSI